MRKSYPYLQEAYSPNLNEEQEKRNFLALLDNFINQRQYVNLTLLDWEENPLQEIQGIISSGSISKDGASSVRRTCSLSCSVDGESYNVDSLDMLFSINKKIFIEIGIKNETDQYLEYPILWFPQGVFYIDSFSMNSSTSSAVNVNLSLKDKMSLLNGEVGGVLPTTVQFDIMDTQVESGEWVQQKVLIYNIINELVNHYGGEDLNNIIIEDVPLRIRKIMQWQGDNPLYGAVILDDSAENPEQWYFSLDANDSNFKDITPSIYEKGMDVGYIYSDFIVTEELVGSAGDNVCSILDKIKNILGNYEYFYDEMGIFHFREIKNYLNINQSSILLEEMESNLDAGRYLNIQGGQFRLDTSLESQYLIETTNKKALYSFSDNQNITSITVTPNYSNIKNDYIVEGLRQSTSSDVAVHIRYHLAIDELPALTVKKDNKWYYEKYENLILYTDESDGNLNKLGFYELCTELPEVGNFDKIYGIKEKSSTNSSSNISSKYETDKTDLSFYYWDNTGYKKLVWLDPNIEDEDLRRKAPRYYKNYYVKDWRTYLYIYALAANNNGTDEGPYSAELQAFWPGEYDLARDKQRFWGEEATLKDGKYYVGYYTLSTGNYYLDFIDSNSSILGGYSIQNIGRRTNVVYNEDINCLFQPEIPDVVFLNTSDPTVNWTENTTGILTSADIVDMYKQITGINDNTSIENKILTIQRKECIDNLQPYAQVPEEIYSNLAIGGYTNGAYDEIKYDLFCHTNYQKVVTITALPVFYLEPNSRIELSDHTTNTYGDFMVQNISLTLGPGANMSVTLNEVNERL